MSWAGELSRVLLRGCASFRALSCISGRAPTNALLDIYSGMAEVSFVRTAVSIRLYATIPGVEIPSPEIPTPPTDGNSDGAPRRAWSGAGAGGI
ncbi:hypothetical protein WJX81_006921 [Elliptochloris bilobata]|uniref:Uncharacterized protein n=1 Tax=Elliptochloris bilobata TaxID=381761 RepID=A0AAW1RDU3_9CHLO